MRDAVKKEMIKQDKSFLEAVLAGVYTVPGDGVINFTEIINFLKALFFFLLLDFPIVQMNLGNCQKK